MLSFTTSDIEEGENKQIYFDVKIDNEAPSTSYGFEGPNDFIESATYYVDTATELRLTAEDEAACDSGVSTTYYRLDSGNWIEYDGLLNLSELVDGQEGNYTFEWYSVDNVGNEESVNEITFIYDGTAPEVNLENVGSPNFSDDGQYYVNTSTDITLACSDNSSEFQSGVNTIYYEWTRTDENETEHESDLVSVEADETTFSFEQTSSHELRYWCTDNVEKQSEVKTTTFNVDEEAPEFQTSVHDNVWFVGEFNGSELVSEEGGYFNLSNVYDPVPVHASGVSHCTVEVRDSDGNLDEAYGHDGVFGDVDTSEDFTMEFQRDSFHNVTVTCEDNLGNMNSESTIVYVDGEAPEVNSFRNDNELDETANPVGINNTILVNATDNKVGVENVTWGYEYTGNLSTECSTSEYDSSIATNVATDSEASFDWTDNTTGYYTLHYSATDSYGQTTTDTRCLVFDGTTPEGNETTDTVVENDTFYVTQNTDVGFECTTPSNFTEIEGLSISVDWITSVDSEHADAETVAETTERYCSEAFNTTGGASYNSETERCEIEGTSIEYNFQEDTEHLVEYQCVDTVDNTFIANYTYFVDTVPPTTVANELGPQYIDSDGNFFLNGQSGFQLEVLNWGPHLNNGTTYYNFKQVQDEICTIEEDILEGVWTGWYVNGHLTSNESVGDGESSSDNRGDFEFTTRNGEEVLSLQVDDSGVAARTYQYRSMKLSDIEELYYTTFNEDDSATATLQVEWVRNWSDDQTYQGNLIYIPQSNVDINGNAPTTGEFQTWNTTDGYWTTSDSSWSGTWEDLMAEYPEAQFHPNFGRLGFKLGTRSDNVESGVKEVKINDAVHEFRKDEFVEGMDFQEKIGPVTKYDGESIPTGQESCHVLEFFSKDWLNNTEEVNQNYYFVDNTAPEPVKTVGEPNVFSGEGQDICFDTQMVEMPETEPEFDEIQMASADDREGSDFDASEISALQGAGEGPCANATQPEQCAYLNVSDMPQYAKDSAEAMGANLAQCATEKALILSSGDPMSSSLSPSYNMGNPGCGPQGDETNPDGHSTNDCVDLEGYTAMDNLLVLGISTEYPTYLGSAFTDWMRIQTPLVSVDVSIDNWDQNMVESVNGNGVIQLAEITEGNSADFRVSDSTDSILDSMLLAMPSDCYENVSPQEDLETQPVEESEVCYDTYNYVTSETEITLSCVDQEPHPSGANKMYLELNWAENETEDLSTHAQAANVCEEHNGVFHEESGVCELNITDGEEITLTLPEESYHELSFWCEDNVGKASEPNRQLYAVDNTGPETTKEVHEPSEPWDGANAKWYNETNFNGEFNDGSTNAAEFCDEEGTCYEVTLMTPLSLTCEDPQPHPSGVSSVTFQVELDGFQTGEKSVENVTEYYCDEYDGTLSEDGLWCTVETDGEGIEEFYFLELSEHRLQYYCEDNLGNVGETNEQLYKVHEGAFGIELTQKWNLVSVPYVLLDNSVDAVFGDLENVTTVWAYQNGSWLYYDATTGQGTLETIEPGYGYWVQANETDEFVIGGSLFQPAQAPPSVDVKAGWNLLGPYGLGELREDMEWRFDGLVGAQDHNTLNETFFYSGPETSEYGRSAECALYGLADSVYNSQAGSVYGYWEDFQPTSWYNTADGNQFDQPTQEPVMFTGGGYWVNLQDDGSFAPTSWCGPFAGNTALN